MNLLELRRKIEKTNPTENSAGECSVEAIFSVFCSAVALTFVVSRIRFADKCSLRQRILSSFGETIEFALTSFSMSKSME